MKKFITILGIITISFHSIIFAQNQKVLLLGECDKEATMNMLNYLNERSKIALTTENNIELSIENISSYPIILICNNDYLKLTNQDVVLLENHLKQGGLLILDNITSDYTYSIFLDKILPEFEEKSLYLDIFFKENLFQINLDEANIDLGGIFINNKLALLGIKKESLINQWNDRNEEFFKIGSSIIFYNLTR
jgi:hypothetical protein|tara:strand:- start:295 stop:873 length:579 start_codon:yes stop_codon:yes gene_type:complete